MKRIITSIALAFTISTQFLFGNIISYNKGHIIYQHTDDKMMLFISSVYINLVK